jgi:hypothetical protein
MRKVLVISCATAFALGATFLFAVLSTPGVSAEGQPVCLSCHADPTLGKTNGAGQRVPLYVNKQTLDISAHRYIECTTCHTSDPHAVETPLTKQSLAEKCGTCHQYQYKLHLASVHGEQLALGNPDVATCVDCHSETGDPHGVIRVLEYDAPAYKKNVSGTCGQCHNNEALMEKYGIVEKVYETYMRSFHGKAIQLSSYDLRKLNKATCTSCHGVHDIRAITDPSSPVAGLENLTRTCEECHPGAGVELAKGFLGHKEVSTKHAPGVFFVEKFFIVLTSSVIALGLLVVGAAMVRWGINRWRE